ncbi:restriction endonuclease subunit S [Aliiruegeria sabulilitoris]|uniref:restriction endonuclease subunit S n=1 Tax=Aliiruegeria sabulilitoris TaxID=1510458 RepID=UPI000835CA8D|nr:restriction endonuclease subunit S [Aliiruegeria sabulilitoris]NDR55688.1 restriction endonuclease subunit S [Pseudoruegeria sp. M32A2M]
MTAKKTHRLVPKLRFPSFSDDAFWLAKQLDEICDRVNETVGDTRLTPVSISAGKGFVPQSEKFGRDISGAQYSKYIRLRRGDLAYNRGNSKRFPQGCVYQLTELDEAAASNAFHCFRLHDHIEPSFVLGFFEDNGHGRQLIRHITSGARSNGLLNISAGTFYGITIPLPPTVAEQQKIADCLGSLDDLIEAETRKLDALRQHKQGLLQQLFPQPEKNLPVLRFPEFQNEKEWEELSIQEMMDKNLIVGHLDGNHGALYPRAEEFTEDKGGVPYISANDFMNGEVDFSKCRRLPIDRARQFKKGVAKDGDILFAHNATVGPVAKLSIDRDFVILSTTATYFRCNGKFLSNDFLKYGLASPNFVAQYSGVMAQSTRNQVPITAQRKLKLQLAGLPEQQRIAKCLSDLDAVLSAQVRRLDSLVSHKKGLLQQLFPSLEGQKP